MSYTIALTSLLFLPSCHTVEAVQALPTDFWCNCELLLYAVWHDIWSVIDLML